MNSWKSSEFCACAPPFTTFIIGTGRTFALVPPSHRYRGSSASSAAARAGRAIRRGSRWRRARLLGRAIECDHYASTFTDPSRPCPRAPAISSLTFATAASRPCRAGVAAVAKLDRLVLARRGAGRHRRAPNAPVPARPPPRPWDCRGIEHLRAWTWTMSSRGTSLAPSTQWLVSRSTSRDPGRRATGSFASTYHAPGRRDRARTTSACLGREPLGVLDARDEAGSSPGGRARDPRFDTRDVHDGEERSPNSRTPRVGLGFGCGPAGARELDSISPSSSRIFASGPSSPGQSNPTAAARRCTLRAWISPGSASGTSWKTPAPLLLGLDLLPPLAHPPRRVRHRVAEHVRVAADELRVDRPGDRLEVAVPLLLEQQGEEIRLEEQVAELVEQLRRIAGVRGVGDLVRLLDRVRHDRPRRLLPVPGAVAAEPPRQLLQVDERLGEPLGRPLAATRSAGGRRRWSPPPAGRTRLRTSTFFAKYLFTSSVHFVIASFFACLGASARSRV